MFYYLPWHHCVVAVRDRLHDEQQHEHGLCDDEDDGDYDEQHKHGDAHDDEDDELPRRRHASEGGADSGGYDDDGGGGARVELAVLLQLQLHRRRQKHEVAALEAWQQPDDDVLLSCDESGDEEA